MPPTNNIEHRWDGKKNNRKATDNNKQEINKPKQTELEQATTQTCCGLLMSTREHVARPKMPKKVVFKYEKTQGRP